mgnify:CR=1 FL=1
MTPSNQSGSQSGSITDTARKAAEDLKETGKEALHGAKSVMGSTMSDLKAGATAKAEEVRETIADEGERMASSLREAAGQQSGMQGRVLETMASGVASVSDTIRSRDVSTLMADIQSYAKRNPAIFVAAAAAAGLLLARLAAQAGRTQDDSLGSYGRTGLQAGDMGSGLTQGGMGTSSGSYGSSSGSSGAGMGGNPQDMAGDSMKSGGNDDSIGSMGRGPSMGGNL